MDAYTRIVFASMLELRSAPARNNFAHYPDPHHQSFLSIIAMIAVIQHSLIVKTSIVSVIITAAVFAGRFVLRLRLG